MADRLSLEALRYAQAVGETKSFSAAARAYGVTQPALSNGIASLEERLGGKLFDRSPRGVAPTSLGVRLLPLIGRALTEMDSLLAEARRLTQPESASIRMGVSPLIGSHLVARAFTAVCELPTPMGLVLREADMSGLRQGLIAGDLDVILIPSVDPLPRFEHWIIDSEPVVVVGSLPTPATRDVIELAEAREGRFILVPDSCGLTRFTTQLFDTHGVPLRTYPGEAASYRVLEQWANLGLGTALLPRSKLESPDSPHRVVLDEGAEVEIFYEAVWRPDSALAGVLSTLARAIANA